MPILKTDKLFGDFCGVSAAAVGKARQAGKLNKTKEGYDTTDPLNNKYFQGGSVKALAQRGIVIDYPNKNKGITDLDTEKMKADIALRKKQARKLDREHDAAMKHTVPEELMVIWIGYFAAGIRNNFLNVGNRVARGDTKLRDRIEKEIKRAIEKTIDEVCRGLKDESEPILKAINGEQDEK